MLFSRLCEQAKVRWADRAQLNRLPRRTDIGNPEWEASVKTDDEILASAMRYWEQARSARTLALDLIPIIRTAENLDSILSQLSAQARAAAVREFRDGYGPSVDLTGEWGMSAGAYTDPEAHRREHEQFVAHANGVAIPAIRAWLAAHPDATR